LRSWSFALLHAPALEPIPNGESYHKSADQPGCFFSVHDATIRRVPKKGENKKCLRSFCRRVSQPEQHIRVTWLRERTPAGQIFALEFFALRLLFATSAGVF